jgi:hypothetical protein
LTPNIAFGRLRAKLTASRGDTFDGPGRGWLADKRTLRTGIQQLACGLP